MKMKQLSITDLPDYPKIAVTGPKGRLGSWLVDKLGCESLSADITNQVDLIADLALVSPDVVINCAAVTQVDQCEEKDFYEKQAIPVNTNGVFHLRKHFQGLLIHLSTDYVFSGKLGPYKETSNDFNPFNSYGFSKLGGEKVVEIWKDRPSIIVRTTGLFGSDHDFATGLLLSLQEEREFFATKELRGNQTYIPFLAEALVKVAREYVYVKKPPKIINIASKEVISRYDFAIQVANVFGYDPTFIFPVKNKDISSWKAKRPTKGGLNCSYAEKLGLPIHTVLEGLQAFCERINVE
jgi:dTDP-4-dehydrorhamnose reductase